MPLANDQALWITLFTGGKVKLSDEQKSGQDDVTNLAAELQMAQDREFSEEQALKEILLAKAIAAIEKSKEDLRKTQAFEVESEDEKGKKKTEQTRRDDGRQELGFEAQESKKATKIGGKDIKSKEAGLQLAAATNAMRALTEESDKLEKMTTPRSHIDRKTKTIVQTPEPLFSAKEIMDELYTPLVREKVLAETFIPPKYSATQTMIDGSDDYYVKECREKGKEIDTGGAAFTKGAINLGATVATTVISSLTPVSGGQQGLDHSGAMNSIDAAKATDITNGIAATLTGLIDIGDTAMDVYKGGEFPVSGFRAIVSTLGVAIGKIVSGATGNENLGLTIAESIGGAADGGTIVVAVAKWAKNPSDDPPFDIVIDAVGSAISHSYNAKSDQTGDSKESTVWANAAGIVATSFSTIARASKQNLITCMRNGQWEKVFDFLADTGQDVGKMLPSVLKFNEQYNNIPGETPQDQIAAQQKLLKALSTFQGGADTFADGSKALLKVMGEALGEKIPEVPAQKLSDEMQKKFDEKQKKINDDKEKADESDIGKIEERLKKAREDYQESLICLGSTEPSDSEYKSIAKLIAQLERDKAIWNGLTALFGGGIGGASGLTAAMSVASEVAPVLKAAGQLVKYITNLKAAADRLSAWLDWKEGQKDSASAVSPYATSIDNFARNQGAQFTHYTVQAAANAIQALLACGEMSPLAPAFKIAGASVGAGAAAEDLVFKFYKQVALRKAWSATKEALDPKNKGNRKMALLARDLNPTLAKYTIAYGALIAKDPIAITALNRTGLDRETLARAKDKVGDVHNYLAKLYSDDGEVIGVLDVPGGKSNVKVPDVKLTAKTWALSCALWKKGDGMQTESPPLIVASLVIVEPLLAKPVEDLETKELDKLTKSLGKLSSEFRDFEPMKSDDTECGPAKAYAVRYAEEAESKLEAITLLAGAIQEVGETVGSGVTL